MNGNYLLDKNIVVGFFRGALTIRNKVAQANQICVSNIVLGELYFGAYKSNLQQRNIQQLGTFAAHSTTLTCNGITAQQYGLLKQQLQAIGRMIPDNDVWIAATALQYGLTLVTQDAHFNAVANLSQEVW